MAEDAYPRWFNKTKSRGHLSEVTQSNPYPGLLMWLILLFLLFLFCTNVWQWFSLEVLGNSYSATGEELDWLTQQTPTQKDAILNAWTDKQAYSSLTNAFFIFLLAIPLVVAIVKIKAARSR